MIAFRPSGKRGHNTIDWLTSYHTFSFADYYDEAWMRRGYLRVINEDYIQPGQGFNTHPHRDMEIITYVIQGELRHQDSMGNGSIIKPGEIQRMSAGTGIHHSEFNNSSTEELHLLQIWVLPEKKGISPSYEQKKIDQKRNQLVLLGTPDPTHDAVKIHQHIELYAGYFDRAHSVSCVLDNQDTWIQLIDGALNVNETEIKAGDGVWVQKEQQIVLNCVKDTEFLLFKMI